MVGLLRVHGGCQLACSTWRTADMPITQADIGDIADTRTLFARQSWTNSGHTDSAKTPCATATDFAPCPSPARPSAVANAGAFDVGGAIAVARGGGGRVAGGGGGGGGRVAGDRAFCCGGRWCTGIAGRAGGRVGVFGAGRIARCGGGGIAGCAGVGATLWRFQGGGPSVTFECARGVTKATL